LPFDSFFVKFIISPTFLPACNHSIIMLPDAVTCNQMTARF
jgi:hypothetical protein